jgi:3-hydroxymyristoyl/3-hydroxydecanoyl-(acyl carrier protein) dehydratase
MSDNDTFLSEYLLTEHPSTQKIAYHNRHYFYIDAFKAAVGYWTDRLQAQSFTRYALYTEDAYPFAVLLFALFHAGKQVWIAGNNLAGTAQQLQLHGCQLLGDWHTEHPFNYQLTAAQPTSTVLSALNPADTYLMLFTSGSTGEAKPIKKHLIHLQREIITLEKQWGSLLGCSAILATVSHQHIYGLLFRVLWPLSAGRCFHSSVYLNPENIAHLSQNIPACWVASPAHLKRLDQNSPWSAIAGLSAIFSSGGVLHEPIKQLIYKHSGQHVIEIYGSTETGGIAWRQKESAWQLFDGLHVSTVNDNSLLHSPYLSKSNLVVGFPLNDQLDMYADGRFTLLGRTDRIVKIEEKRLSLTELEQRITSTPWVSEAFTLALSKSRDIVGAAVVLTPEGHQQLAANGQNALIKQLRTQLRRWFDAVVVPRKWLIIDSLPLSPQGKINQALLKTLLDLNTQKLPQLHSVCAGLDTVILNLRVPEELLYFPDHFTSYPLLPGVVQIAWVEYFSQLFFTIDQDFLAMEVIKFVKTIHPGDALVLTLHWNSTTNKLQFNFCSGDIPYSSGRLLYTGKHSIQ